ncbi:hypothetical protein EVAR_50496_1 [Eumeta japonica]|uniref:Uncharacterized protein n=1 Tax=Eumeta variegata TaxID=151549 RepID=A0A4C2A0T3_EUMVA|nr:hypothetical protein EVAR_50496_1 [Eumeta japonica]
MANNIPSNPAPSSSKPAFLGELWSYSRRDQYISFNSRHNGDAGSAFTRHSPFVDWSLFASLRCPTITDETITPRGGGAAMVQVRLRGENHPTSDLQQRGAGATTSSVPGHDKPLFFLETRIDQLVSNLSHLKPLPLCLGEDVKPSVSDASTPTTPAGPLGGA